MKIKKNDTVKILSGKDKGKTGKVLRVLQSIKLHQLVVEGLNLRFKHIKAKREGEQGQRIMFPYPINISNVALICPKCNQPIRISYKVLAQAPENSHEKKQRICRKCEAVV